MLAFFERGAGAVNQGVIAQLATGGRGVLFKAYLRAVTNTALGLGSVFGGAALVIDERWAYVTVFVLNAVFTGFAAWNSTRLPDIAPHARAAGEPRLAVVRDWPFVVITVITGLFSLHFFVMELGLALYVSARTPPPPSWWRSCSSSTPPPSPSSRCGCPVAPTPSRPVPGPSCAGRGGSRPASPSSPLADRGTRWLAVGVLVVGSLVHVVGEMIGSGGQWGLQMGLAPHERQGQYQGFAGLGFSVLAVVAPPVVTSSASASARPAGSSWRPSWSSSRSSRSRQRAGRWRRGPATASRRTRADRLPRARRRGRAQRRRTSTVSTLMDRNGGPSDLKSSPPPLAMCCTTSSPESTCPMRE